MQRPDPSSQNTDWMVCKGDILVFARYVSCQNYDYCEKKKSLQDMYSNGMLLKEINDCIESFELFLDAISTNKLLLEDDLLEIKLQFAKLKSCDSFILLKNLRRPSKVGKLTTIVHGELWDRNVLLNDTYQVIVLDWKNAKLASATLDLAFLMLSSTTWYVSALLHICCIL